MVVLVLLKLGGVQAHVCEDSAGVVHRNHANTVLIEHQAHLHQHGLETLGEDTNGSRLNCLGHYNVLRVSRHLSMLPMSSESRFTRFALTTFGCLATTALS